DVDEPPLEVEGAIADRRELVEVGVAGAHLLEALLRLAELAVLHLQLDLMDVEIVDELLAVRRLVARGAATLRRPHLVELADQLVPGHLLDGLIGHGVSCGGGSIERRTRGASAATGIGPPPTRRTRSRPSAATTRIR